MRYAQFIGLTTKAKELLNSYKEQKTCLTCSHVTTPWKDNFEAKYYKHIIGMFGEIEGEFHEYYLNEEFLFREIIQAEPWSSGPVIFLALEKKDGTLIHPWTEDEINNA